MEENSAEQWPFRARLSYILGKHSSVETHDAFLCEFNKPTSKFRRVLSDILLAQGDLSIDMFSEDAISFLIADLNQRKILLPFQQYLLGYIATEQFVTERLLPLLSRSQSPFLEHLRSVLQQAGDRHGRRYITK
jgi:hypothetical protein